VGETLYGPDDEMIGFIIGAVLFSIPTVYYRIKLKKCKAEKKKIASSAWQWQEWGE
jgi:uncharacterized membrane protein YciS (DUF1049 family)